MSKQKITGLSASFLQQTPPSAAPEGAEYRPEAPEQGKPVVQTVKVPQDVYVRLKTVGARERRSSQDIILSAVREYLDRLSPAP